MDNKKKILIFSVLFFALQAIDLYLTSIFIKEHGKWGELNPLYFQIWFYPLKLSSVLLISPVMYWAYPKIPKITNRVMYGIIIMYVLICLNNLYWVII